VGGKKRGGGSIRKDRKMKKIIRGEIFKRQGRILRCQGNRKGEGGGYL